MTTLFRLDASIRATGSTTRALADRIERAVVDAAGVSSVVRRDVGVEPISATAWPASIAAAGIPPQQWTTEQQDARATADTLATELEDADAFLFAAPLYNWGVSQHLKTWADLVMTDPRFLPRTRTVAGRPGVLVVARGGDYRDASAQSEWDHASAWMRRLFQDVWSIELRVVGVHLTLAPVREYLAHLRPDAATDLERATADADAAGAELAELIRERAGARAATS